MSHVSGAPDAQLLAGFVAAVYGSADQASAIGAAVDYAIEGFDAELGAVLWEDSATIVGLRADPGLADLMRALVAAPGAGFDLAGVGHCELVVATVAGARAGHFLMGRADAAFSTEETNLIRAMARILSQALAMLQTLHEERTLRERSELQAAENQKLLASLQERQRLLEALSSIESSISRREPLDDILGAIATQARQLMGSDLATLRLIDTDDHAHLLLAAADGMTDDERELRWRMSLQGAAVSARAISAGDVVASCPADGQSGVELPGQARTAIAAPVLEGGTIIGSLLVGTCQPGRQYTQAEHQVLRVFAEHVSLALTDAKTVAEVRQALHDSLTGLASRSLFLDRVEHQILASRRDERSFGLLFLDLDRFKPVNDTLGHAAGDDLLVQVAQRLSESVRPSDTVARFGGDEFAILLCGVQLAETELVARRIADRIREPFVVAGKTVFINASIGIAIRILGRDTSELVSNADVAMYRAKRRGEGQVAVYEPAMHDEMLVRMRMEAELRLALARGQMVVDYKPIVELSTGAITAFEAKVSWNHPEFGVVDAAAFTTLADEASMTFSISEWVLEHACSRARDWSVGTQPVALYAGVSWAQLRQPGYAAQLIERLASWGFAPERLVLQIAQVMTDGAGLVVEAELRALRAAGIRIAIDRFGSGFGSLSDLPRLPADILKIGGSFVRSLGEGPSGDLFSTAVLHLGQTLELKTIASDIETPDQLARLVESGCRYGQGSYIGAPMTPAHAELAMRAGCVALRATWGPEAAGVSAGG